MQHSNANIKLSHTQQIKQDGGGTMRRKMIHEPYNRLKGFAREKGITYEDIGKLIGVTPSTVSMKINGYSDFYLSEQKLISKQYNAQGDIFL